MGRPVSEPNVDSDRESETIDTHLSVLASTECRYVIYYFRRTSGDVASLGDIAEFVTANADAPTTGSRERTEIRLHHYALPRLAETGVLEYDERDGLVRYRGSPGLEEFAAVAAEKEPGLVTTPE